MISGLSSLALDTPPLNLVSLFYSFKDSLSGRVDGYPLKGRNFGLLKTNVGREDFRLFVCSFCDSCFSLISVAEN